MKSNNWRTTLAGILTILVAVLGVVIKVLTGHGVDTTSLAALVAAITAGAGLIKAGDAANVPPK